MMRKQIATTVQETTEKAKTALTSTTTIIVFALICGCLAIATSILLAAQIIAGTS